MPPVTYIDGIAHCERISLKSLAERYGTPLYVYSRLQLLENCRAFLDAFRDYPVKAFFAVKANGNLSLLREVSREGFGADVVSLGELERALAAGLTPDRIVFSGVGKDEREIRRALEIGILSLNVESTAELELVAAIARSLKVTAPVAIRVNPDIDPHTHPAIATGLGENKFGIPETELDRVLEGCLRQPFLAIKGLACHLGSQITELAPFQQAAQRLARLVERWKERGARLCWLDLGGGLGVTYHEEKPPPLADYASTILEAIRPTGLPLFLEPGRRIIADTGILVTRVLRTKQMPKRRFVIVDASMTELIRPSLYGAWHPILAAQERSATTKADVVGPVCESGDWLGRDRWLPALEPGDLLLVGNAGAYGMSMASRYNARPMAAEVLVDGNTPLLIRERETFSDLVAKERHLLR